MFWPKGLGSIRGNQWLHHDQREWWHKPAKGCDLQCCYNLPAAQCNPCHPKILVQQCLAGQKFGDIYQEDFFINYLKSDIRIVKDLPVELQSLDLEVIGSLVNDTDVMKEAKPSLYVKKILPILLRNRVVHFIGFGNRLSFDPIPSDLQVLLPSVTQSSFWTLIIWYGLCTIMWAANLLFVVYL